MRISKAGSKEEEPKKFLAAPFFSPSYFVTALVCLSLWKEL
jgi:hypothetical protein